MPKYDTAPDAVLARLNALVRRTETCWLWTGGTYPKGYGAFWFNNHHRRAHRVAWQLTVGPVPSGRIIGHTCDTPACIRYDDTGVYIVNGTEYERHGHLWLATPVANMADRDAKRRTAVGEHNGNARLTPEQVAAIREDRRLHGTPFYVLAARFGVTERTVSLIVKGITWRD